MESLILRVERALEWIVLTLLGLLTLSALFETLAWSLLQVSIAQLAEIQSVLLVWFTLLSAAWAVSRGLHLAIDWLPATAKRDVRRSLDAVALIATATFGVAMAVYGWALTGAVRNTLPATGLPASVQYAATIVAGSLIAFFAIVRIPGSGNPRV